MFINDFNLATISATMDQYLAFTLSLQSKQDPWNVDIRVEVK